MANQKLVYELDGEGGDFMAVDPEEGLDPENDAAEVSPDEESKANYQQDTTEDEESSDSESGQDSEGEAEEAEDSEEEDSDKGKKQSRFQKRIDQLTKQQREAEREREEAYEFAKKVYEQNQQLLQRAYHTDTNYLKSENERLNALEEKATNLYKQAAEEGDTEKQLEASKTLSQVQSRRTQLEQAQNRVRPEAYRPRYEMPQPKPRVDPRAEEWAERNPWFNQDPVARNSAIAISNSLIQQGVDPNTDEYYAKLDSEIKRLMPSVVESSASSGEEAQHSNKQKPSRPPVGDARQSGSAGKRKSNKVGLSPTEQAVAKRLGLSFEEYAKQKRALEN